MAVSAAAGAVFLDKDGTLIDDVPYNVDPARMTLARGAAEGLPLLHAAGYRVFVVSNQAGVARGRFTERALDSVAERLTTLLAGVGVPLAGFYYCPHDPRGSVAEYAVRCDCRKPAPGLLHRAAREHALDLAASWLVGDILDDVEAGRRAGCATVLLNVGSETEWVRAPMREPHHVARDLAEAARIILRDAAPDAARTRALGGIQASAPRRVMPGAAA